MWPYSIVTDSSIPDVSPDDRRGILYVLQVDDLRGIYEERKFFPRWKDLTYDQKASLIRASQKYLDSFIGEGAYTWYDAVKDSITDQAKSLGIKIPEEDEDESFMDMS